MPSAHAHYFTITSHYIYITLLYITLQNLHIDNDTKELYEGIIQS